MILKHFKSPMVVLAIIVCASVPVVAQISTAKVTGGMVEGVVKDGIASFKGVPFAAPRAATLQRTSANS